MKPETPPVIALRLWDRKADRVLPTKTRAKRFILWMGVVLLLAEVTARCMNMRSIRLVPVRIETGKLNLAGYHPGLICELHNTHATRISYCAVSEDFPAFEIIHRDAKGFELSSNVQSWCTADFDFTMPPFSKRELFIPISYCGEKDAFEISVFCENTSLFSWITDRFTHTDELRATAHVDLKHLPSKTVE